LVDIWVALNGVKEYAIANAEGDSGFRVFLFQGDYRRGGGNQIANSTDQSDKNGFRVRAGAGNAQPFLED
jgi:hypothetical protein